MIGLSRRANRYGSRISLKVGLGSRRKEDSTHSDFLSPATDFEPATSDEAERKVNHLEGQRYIN